MPSMPSLLLFKIVLLANVLLSIYTVIYLTSQDGLGDHLRELIESKKAWYPGTSARLRHQYTKIAPIDRQLTLLVSLFAEAIDRTRPASVIQAMHFGLQFGAAGLLLALEGARTGHRGKSISWTTLTANLAQNISFAVTAPNYFLMHLFVSDTSSSPTARSIAVSPVFAASIPITFVLGYLLPTVALILPAPSVISYDTSQKISAAWQAFPIYVALIHMGVQRVLGVVYPTLLSQSGRTSRMKSALRAAYIYGIVSSAWGHIGIVSLWTMRSVVPGIFARSFPSLASVFVPRAFWLQDAQKLKPGAAATLLLQWDEICGSLATFTWAAASLWGGLHATNQANSRSFAVAGIASLAATGILGPCGAAVAMIWARDEMIWAASDEDEAVERKGQ